MRMMEVRSKIEPPLFRISRSVFISPRLAAQMDLEIAVSSNSSGDSPRKVAGRERTLDEASSSLDRCWTGGVFNEETLALRVGTRTELRFANL